MEPQSPGFPVVKKKSLYDLLNEVNHIENLLTEVSDEEFTLLLQQMSSEVVEQARDKIDRYKFLIDALSSRAPFWEQRAKEAQRVQRSILSVCERIKGALKGAMQAHGLQQIAGQEYRAQLSNAKPALVIDESQLPDLWRMEVRTLVVDKEMIRAALDRGEVIPGARLELSYTLRFYPSRPNDKTKEIQNDK
jgi:hypothetical protein